MENLAEYRKSDITIDQVALSDAIDAMTDVLSVLVFIKETATHTGYLNPAPFVEMVDKIMPDQVDALERAMNKLQGTDCE